jgi:hypothetical protein
MRFLTCSIVSKNGWICWWMGEWVSERVGESVSNWSLQPNYTSSSNSTKRSGDADYKCETTSFCQSWESGVRVLTTSDRNTRIVSLLALTRRFNNTSAETTCAPFLGSKRVILKQIHYSISRFPFIIWWEPLMVAQWLRYCATNRKVVGSIPDGFIILRIAPWPWGRLSL